MQQGSNIKVWLSDNGSIGYLQGEWYARHNGLNSNEVRGCQYPEYSLLEHIMEGGLWVGAIIDTAHEGQSPHLAKFVTSTDTRFSTSINRFWGETTAADSLHPFRYTSSFNDTNAVSESDYYCEYTDTARLTDLPDHKPLGIKVLQRSYAWGQSMRKPILPIEYSIVNLGYRELRNVYIGIEMEAYISYSYPATNVAGYWPELKTAYVSDPLHSDYTPIGFTILKSPYASGDDRIRFRWFNTNEFVLDFFNQKEQFIYDAMSGTNSNDTLLIQPDQPLDELNEMDVLLSFGPFNNWAVGDTLKLAYAIVSGSLLRYGGDNLYDNAIAAQTLYARGYIPPIVLPAPKLRIETGFNKVELHWGYTGTGINPEDVWDDANQLIYFYPPDHWRRINPPAGHTTGGRVFAGYRLYRSEDPAGTANSFTMLRQWDVNDSVKQQLGYQTGIETTFVDDHLTTGKTYWYSITSFGIPDLHMMDYLDRDGTVKKETLATASLGTSVLASRKRVKMPFSVSNELNKVTVVPNPYSISEDYTFENGGYEGRQKSWNEDKRVLKFIHLPKKCTIRIYTVTGEIVSTLYHEDPVQGEHNWNLKSDSNRSIASGVYVFSVESDLGTQIGKFVVIR